MRILACCLLALLVATTFTTANAVERSWIQIHYAPEVQADTRGHVEGAVDLVADMLTEYKLTLLRKITVVVTSDQESYMKALITLGGFTIEKAKATAEHSSGISLGSKPLILIKGTQALQTNRSEVYRVLPHEIFHQVQTQFGHQNTAVWMTEAAPELFQIFARERAGFDSVQTSVNRTAVSIIKANAIPSAQQLITTNYENFTALSYQGYPVYAMSLVMLYHLAGKDQFDPVLQYYRLLNSGMKPENAFVALFRRPQSIFATEMDKVFSTLRQSRSQ